MEYRDLTAEEAEGVEKMDGFRYCAVRYPDGDSWWLYWESQGEYESRINGR